MCSARQTLVAPGQPAISLYNGQHTNECASYTGCSFKLTHCISAMVVFEGRSQRKPGETHNKCANDERADDGPYRPSPTHMLVAPARWTIRYMSKYFRRAYGTVCGTHEDPNNVHYSSANCIVYLRMTYASMPTVNMYALEIRSRYDPRQEQQTMGVKARVHSDTHVLAHVRYIHTRCH